MEALSGIVGHDSKNYVEQIDSRVRARIAHECALEVLREVMVHGCVGDLNEVQAKYRIALDSKTGRDLLSDMVEVSSLENLRWLVAHLVDINVMNGCGETVLMLKIINRYSYSMNRSSIEEGLKNVITKLLELGADCRIANNAGNTSLHLLVDDYYFFDGTAQELIRLLVGHGADLNAKNTDGKTVLKMACNERMADFILRQTECKPTHRKFNRAVIINKNNFRNNDNFRWCERSGAIKEAMSRIEDAALDFCIQLPDAQLAKSGTRDVIM